MALFQPCIILIFPSSEMKHLVDQYVKDLVAYVACRIVAHGNTAMHFSSQFCAFAKTPSRKSAQNYYFFWTYANFLTFFFNFSFILLFPILFRCHIIRHATLRHCDKLSLSNGYRNDMLTLVYSTRLFPISAQRYCFFRNKKTSCRFFFILICTSHYNHFFATK